MTLGDTINSKAVLGLQSPVGAPKGLPNPVTDLAKLLRVVGTQTKLKTKAPVSTVSLWQQES